MDLKNERRRVIGVTGVALGHCGNEPHDHPEPAKAEENQEEVAIPFVEGEEAAAIKWSRCDADPRRVRSVHRPLPRSGDSRARGLCRDNPASRSTTLSPKYPPNRSFCLRSGLRRDSFMTSWGVLRAV